jgi:hypothetical protein
MDEHEHSYARYQALRKQGLACPGCRACATEYRRAHRHANPEFRSRERAKASAYGRALRRLAKRHPVELRALVAEERAKKQ